MRRCFLVLLVIFTIIFSLPVIAGEGLSFYGDMSAYVFKREFNNDSFLYDFYETKDDMVSSLASQMYFSLTDEFLWELFS